MRHNAKTYAAAVVFVSGLVSALASASCEEKKETPKPPFVIAPQYGQDPSTNARPPATASNAGSAPSQAPTSNEPTALDLALAADASAPPAFLKRTIETVIPVDPDQAILDAAHMRAASCYDGNVVSSVPRSATIHVTVIPTGKVTRAEVVSTDTTEPHVLDCLKSLGEGLVFTERFEQPKKPGSSGNTADTKTPTSGSNGGGLRTYAINVAVVPAH